MKVLTTAPPRFVWLRELLQAVKLRARAWNLEVRIRSAENDIRHMQQMADILPLQIESYRGCVEAWRVEQIGLMRGKK